MGIDNKIELTQASGNFKKRYSKDKGNMVSKSPPILLSFTIKQSFKKTILKPNKNILLNALHRLKQPLPNTHK